MLTTRQHIRVMRALTAKYGTTVTKSWTRLEFNAKVSEMAKEMGL